MFDQTILQIVVLTMLILTCKGTGAIPGQTLQRQMPSGIRLVQVSLQHCIQGCEARPSCLQIVYSRHCFLCELLEDVQADLADNDSGQLVFTDSLRVVWTKPRPHESTVKCGVNQCVEGEYCDGNNLVCLVRECKAIEVPVGRRLLGNVLSVNTSAALVCDAGFVPDTTVVTCTANGTWSPHPSPCECKPIDVPIGRRLLSNVSTVGSSATLVCDAGFVPDTTVVTCTANGTWSPRPSSCECKPIDVPIGRRLLGNVSTVDSSAVLVCDVGYLPDTTVVTCTADGTWKPSLSACVIDESSWCSADWKYYNGSCYMFGTIDQTFFEAQAMCVSNGASLVNVETQEEHEFLQSVLKGITAGVHWIGLTDIVHEGVWTLYPSEVEAHFSAWGGIEPNGNDSINCAAIWASFDYAWADEPCNDRLRAICEIQGRPTNSTG